MAETGENVKAPYSPKLPFLSFTSEWQLILVEKTRQAVLLSEHSDPDQVDFTNCSSRSKCLEGA